MRTLLAVTCLSLCACNATPVPPAPDDTNGLYKWTWANLEAASDLDLQQAAVKLFAASDGGSTVKAGLKDLTKPELAVIGMADGGIDPETGSGLYIFHTFPCTADKTEQILADVDQQARYPNTYWSYARTHTADTAKYFARMLKVLTWDTTVGSDVLGARYTAKLKGSLRRVKGPDGTGDFLITRSWMLEPASFERMDGDVTFQLDFHSGIYWEREPGKLFHAYAVWRQTEIKGLMLHSDKPELKNIILDRLIEHDGKTAKACEK